MTKIAEIEITRQVKTVKTFRAKFTATTPHFIQKVIQCRKNIKDAFNGHFHDSMTAWVPKLTPKYQKPCVMLNVANGSSATLIRAKDPLTLATWLEDMAETLRSDSWLDKWEELIFISETLINSTDPVTLDPHFLDVKEFNDAFIEHGREMCNYAKEK